MFFDNTTSKQEIDHHLSSVNLDQDRSYGIDNGRIGRFLSLSKWGFPDMAILVEILYMAISFRLYRISCFKQSNPPNDSTALAIIIK